MRRAAISMIGRRIADRPIIGAVLRTADLAAVARHVAALGGPAPRERQGADHDSLLVEPDLTHGIWLEFRQYR